MCKEYCKVYDPQDKGIDLVLLHIHYEHYEI